MKMWFCFFVFWAFLPGTEAVAQGTFPLVCRGGGQMRFRFSHDTGTFTATFKAGTRPAGQDLVPGECSWRDRGFRTGEPPHICHIGITHFEVFWGDNPTGVIAQSNQVFWYLGDLRNPNALVTFNVFNNGRCMQVV
jgi:hypothetical protein